jgi:hypothetical protein
VAMSMPALLRTYEQLSGVINKMVQQGLLKKTEPTAPVTADVSVPAAEDKTAAKESKKH